MSVGSPITWTDIANLRYQSTNYDASPESFGFIVGPGGRQSFETTARTPGGALTIWDAVKNETEVSKQVNDGRVFAGIWNYLTIGTWGAGTDEFASDLVIDAVTQAISGRVIVTGSCFLESVQLHFQILVMGRHPCVSDPQRLKFSLRHQILETRIKDEETRKTNQEWFSRMQKRPFWRV